VPLVEVHVTTVSEARAAGALSRYLALLTDEERARHARMRPDPRGDEFLVGRALLHHALARHAPAPRRFAATGHGRLELAEAPPAPVSFNLSHAEGLVVCAVAAGALELGIDVEKVDPRRADDAVWEHYFATTEVAALRALPAAERCERFFTYWTLKEAYMKARGLGMALPLHDFWFLVEEGRPVRIAFSAALPDQPQRWQFAQQRLPGDHLIAVAAAPASDPVRLTVERCLP
jgi:4'-phosphopantetheinyl transferase